MQDYEDTFKKEITWKNRIYFSTLSYLNLIFTGECRIFSLHIITMCETSCIKKDSSMVPPSTDKSVEYYKETVADCEPSMSPRHQTPQLQATEITSSDTILNSPSINKTISDLGHEMIKEQHFSLKHPLISKCLATSHTSVENKHQIKQTNSSEGLLRRGFTGPEDIASQKGIFGWTIIDGINLPYLFRYNVKFVAVRMVEMSLLSRYPPEIPPSAKDQPPIISYYVTENEAQLLNEINVSHCSYEFGYDPYNKKDLLVKLSDVERFYNSVKMHYCQLANERHSPDITQIKNLRLLRLKNVIVPYIIRNGSKLVALSSLKSELIKSEKQFLEFSLTVSEIKYLNSCFDLMGITCHLNINSKVVMLEELQHHYNITDLGIVSLSKLNDIHKEPEQSSESNKHQNQKYSLDNQNDTSKTSSLVIVENKCQMPPSSRPPPPLIAMPTYCIQRALPILSNQIPTIHSDSLPVISHVESLAKLPNVSPNSSSELSNNSDASPLNLTNKDRSLHENGYTKTNYNSNNTTFTNTSKNHKYTNSAENQSPEVQTVFSPVNKKTASCTCCQEQYSTSYPEMEKSSCKKNPDNIPIISNIFSLHSGKEKTFFPMVITNNIDNQNVSSPNDYQSNQHFMYEKPDKSLSPVNEMQDPKFQKPFSSTQERTLINMSNDYKNLSQISTDEMNYAAERALWEDHYLEKDDNSTIKYDQLISKFKHKYDSGEKIDHKFADKITHSPLGVQKCGVCFKIHLMLIADQLLPTVNLEPFSLNTNNRGVLLGFVLSTFFPKESFKSLAFVLENLLNVNLLRICSGQILAYKKFFNRLWSKHSWSLTMIRVNDLIQYLPQLKFIFNKDFRNGKRQISCDATEGGTDIKFYENKRSRSE